MIISPLILFQRESEDRRKEKNEREREEEKEEGRGKREERREERRERIILEGRSRRAARVAGVIFLFVETLTHAPCDNRNYFHSFIHRISHMLKKRKNNSNKGGRVKGRQKIKRERRKREEKIKKEMRERKKKT